MTILFVMALSWLAIGAKAQPIDQTNPDSSDITISLITCYPGEEIYELCGHSAIRVRGENIDSVWNYGIFDFDQPNFVYRFVKGETDYKGASYPFRWFLPEYIATGRKVVEQDLNLTPQEAQKLLEVLRVSVLPENATYRYNYVKDNCSTRILNHMDSASSEVIVYPDNIKYGTFRNEMREYHKGYPWYQFGIDLALGSGLDHKIGSREEMFVPVELMEKAGEAKFADGRPLVKATRVLNEGRENATLPPTPWYLGPLFWSCILTLIILSVVIANIISGRLYLPLYAVWFFMLALAGCLIAFLVFISVHEASSPNVLIIWINPLQILYTVSMLVRRLKPLAVFMSLYNIIVIIILFIISPFLTQSFNPAFYPLMLSTAALAFGYAIIRFKSSYKRR